MEALPDAGTHTHTPVSPAAVYKVRDPKKTIRLAAFNRPINQFGANCRSQTLHQQEHMDLRYTFRSDGAPCKSNVVCTELDGEVCHAFGVKVIHKV